LLLLRQARHDNFLPFFFKFFMTTTWTPEADASLKSPFEAPTSALIWRASVFSFFAKPVMTTSCPFSSSFS
ncbi:MAG: hypothetical protein ACRC3J_00145, partial [Culicoidibacterales bacterium]